MATCKEGEVGRQVGTLTALSLPTYLLWNFFLRGGVGPFEHMMSLYYCFLLGAAKT